MKSWTILVYKNNKPLHKYPGIIAKDKKAALRKAKVDLGKGEFSGAMYSAKVIEENMKKAIEFKNLIKEEVKSLFEKAVSKAQQQSAGLALDAKRGNVPAKALRGAAKKMYDSMTEKELEDFAGTKHKGLPSKKESVSEADGNTWTLYVDGKKIKSFKSNVDAIRGQIAHYKRHPKRKSSKVVKESINEAILNEKDLSGQIGIWKLLSSNITEDYPYGLLYHVKRTMTNTSDPEWKKALKFIYSMVKKVEKKIDFYDKKLGDVKFGSRDNPSINDSVNEGRLNEAFWSKVYKAAKKR
tara:strand:+ start:484 stop:1374 length:891 start_codon:yes stop_codon:yes gene_type:complete